MNNGNTTTTTTPQAAVGPDTLITVKVLIDGQNRRFKLALRDLGAHVLPQKLRFLLAVPSDSDVTFERFSDSAASYVALDSANPSVYKQLYRAAKAKLKLRLRATVVPVPAQKTVEPTKIHVEPQVETVKQIPRNTYLETVLSKPAQTPATAPPPRNTTEPTRNPYLRAQAPTAIATLHELSRPTLPTMNDFGTVSFSIDCNSCNKSVPNEHYHCSICENGDFDLCQQCIDGGATCDGEDHWLIKRTIKNGRVFPSMTETVRPKKQDPVEEKAVETMEDDQRTCNSCIIQLPAASFITCQDCPDFDLCFVCLEQGEHGHHPAHSFVPVDPKSTAVSPYIKTLCEQGRGLRHEAMCDGCDKHICGVRHKCLTCPDFDYCKECVTNARETHPGHRFAPIYEQLEMLTGRKEYHRGIYCDGPICAANPRKSYIRGDRYKCAVCDDTDFCANCEATPINGHNKTHPLIKLRSAIRNVTVSTVNEVDDGASSTVHGDRPTARHASTETTRSTSTNAATQVQTVAEVKPVEIAPTEETEKKKESSSSTPVPAGLQAWFECDSTPDGSNFAPNRLMSQSWTLRNPGPQTWPAGCAVYYIGGDDMRNLDDKHPSSVSEMSKANRSNVLEEPLEPGNTAVFTVLLKSPAREGRAISYWRLKTPEGMPFGHKLWVDITIATTAAKPVEAPAPVPVEAPVSIPITDDTDKDSESSQMIFPKLEKESPEASVHTIGQTPSIPVDPSVVSEDQDLLDDLESMALEDEGTEDGFLTDEEYDILDAEDEEYLLEAQRAVTRK